MGKGHPRRWLVAAGLDRHMVVAGADGAVGEQNLGRLAGIEAIGILDGVRGKQVAASAGPASCQRAGVPRLGKTALGVRILMPQAVSPVTPC